MKRSNLLTKNAHTKLVVELEGLERSRPSAVSELAWARDLGDRSENAAYKSARTKLSRLDSRIRFLKKTLENSRIVDNAPKGIIGIGSKVVLKSGDKTVSYEVVGDHETDPLKGKISYRSPLGTKLIGKKEGANFELQTPKGIAKYQVVKIE
ncbi:MAG: GreA/GreB family elongation factor [Patescibacteria group bacterium]